MRAFLFIFCLSQFLAVYAQKDSLLSRIKYEADFRFRLEEDWNSKRSDGSMRDDRTRFRYRARVGFTYASQKKYYVGLRMRTGDRRKQQDPQLTLGTAPAEFGTLAIGFEKAYFEYREKGFRLMLGKNTFPFQKNNELFWSDNVFPEGVYAGKTFSFKEKKLSNITLGAGHFIVEASGGSLDKDSYLTAFQANLSAFNERLKLFPSFYQFGNINNVPDGEGTYQLDYSIAHLGGQFKSKKNIILEFDLYRNLEDYTKNDSVLNVLNAENDGFTASIAYGELKKKGDWFYKITYAYLQRYSAVDFMAQNDWARWDYSNFNSPDGRLTNMQGTEWVISYLLEDNIKLTTKFYQVAQIVATGSHKEDGTRIRFDIDIKF